MKSGINIFVFALLISFSPVLIAGQPDTNGTLQGYWLEYEGGGFSFTSLFVFEPSDQGNIDGKVYFFHDEASTKEFSLGRIKCTGDSLCFIISGSAIYFSGIIDKKGMSVRGSFILDDGTVVPVLHKKIDPDNYSTFPDVQKCSSPKVLKKEVNASSGLEISGIHPPDNLPEKKLFFTQYLIVQELQFSEVG